MTTSDATGKEARRAAYAAYVACFWSWRRLPSGDARRPALALAMQRAEANWRGSMARALGVEQSAGTPKPAGYVRSRPVASALPLDAASEGRALAADDR